MDETEVTRLAVARLTEAGDGAAAYRRSPDRPLQGFCLISGDELGYRISLYLENSKGDLESGAEYLGWIETGTRLEPIGRMAGWAAWEGSAACIREVRAVNLTQETRICVTAGGSQVPVLEGSLVWLQGEPAESETAGRLKLRMAPAVEMEPDPEMGPDPEMAPDPEMEPSAVHTGVGLMGQSVSSEAQAFTLPFCDQEATQPDQPGGEGESQAELETEDDPVGTPAEPVAVLLAETAIEDGAEAESGLDPGTPAEPLAIPLAARHPQAPRASGTAVIDFARGGLTVTLRAMPSPMLLGRDPRGEGTFTGYRVWLMGQNARLRTPVGLCTRVWGENFRLQVESGLNLRPYDTIVVAAAERSGDRPNPTTPQVMVGTFRS